VAGQRLFDAGVDGLQLLAAGQRFGGRPRINSAATCSPGTAMAWARAAATAAPARAVRVAFLTCPARRSQASRRARPARRICAGVT